MSLSIRIFKSFAVPDSTFADELQGDNRVRDPRTGRLVRLDTVDGAMASYRIAEEARAVMNVWGDRYASVATQADDNAARLGDFDAISPAAQKAARRALNCLLVFATALRCMGRVYHANRLPVSVQPVGANPHEPLSSILFLGPWNPLEGERLTANTPHGWEGMGAAIESAAAYNSPAVSLPAGWEEALSSIGGYYSGTMGAIPALAPILLTTLRVVLVAAIGYLTVRLVVPAAERFVGINSAWERQMQEMSAAAFAIMMSPTSTPDERSRAERVWNTINEMSTRFTEPARFGSGVIGVAALAGLAWLVLRD